MSHPWHLPVIPFLILLLISCRPQVSTPEKPVLARVDNRFLYESTLQTIIHPEASQEDSSAMAAAFIDQWVRDQLLMREASRYFSSDFEIERLVDDYRERLLKLNLEEKIVSERYDTSITDLQLHAFYEDTKEQFVLSEDVFRAVFIKFDRKTKSISQFYQDWKKQDEDAIRTFAAAYAEEYHPDTISWKTWDQIDEWYNGFSRTNARAKKAQRQLSAEAQYFLKVIDVAAAGEFAPLGYIENQLKQMLLYRRRQELLESYKQELYEKALSNNLIKMY